ncbi:MAG: LacI family DNA-binding transcriptional regulator [Bacteroidota bacterium]
MKKKLSINDIASQLNVAKSTISFILNGKAKEKRISDELAERVLKYVKEKGYKPNQLARSLSTGKTKMICLMVEKISDYFFSHIAFHLEVLAYKSGYKIIYCSTENDPEKTRELIQLFRDRHVDGYIITPPAGIESAIMELINDELPVVLFDRHFKSIDTDYVVLDNYQGTYNAVAHLADKKYRHIAFVTLQSEQLQMTDREAGYFDAVSKYELTPALLKIPFENDANTTTKNLTSFLNDHHEIDSIVFATNYLALSGVKAINDMQLQIPRDIGIIAFDDHEIFGLYNPTITAVAQPLEQMAVELFKILLDKLENKTPIKQLQQIVVPSKLIVRESTR